MSRMSDKEKIKMWTDISKTASLDRIAEAKERLADANDPKLKAKEELRAQKKLDKYKRKEARKDYLRSIRKENRATLSIIFIISISIFAYSEFNNEITTGMSPPPIGSTNPIPPSKVSIIRIK